MKKFLHGLTFLSMAVMAAPSISSADVDLSILAFGSTFAEPGQDYEFYAQVTNKGSEAISSITYDMIIADVTKEFTLELASPIDKNAKRYVAFKATAPEELGSNTLSIKVTAINGQDVTKNASNGRCTVVEFAPKHRSLVEDYTGTWCGYCPQGYVAMESLARDYPGEALGIAYHNGDPMAVNGFKAPFSPSGYPTVTINRGNAVSAFVSVPGNAVKASNKLAVVGVDMVKASWTDDTHRNIECSASIEFAEAVSDGEYKVEFALIADGLHGTSDSWRQSTYYAGDTGGWNDPLWDQFCDIENLEEETINGNKYYYLPGLEFNDVCVANTLKSGSGFVSSIPATEARTKLEVSHTFKNVNTIKELGSAVKNIIQDPEKCKVAVIVTEASSGDAVNCHWLHVSESAGVGDVVSDFEADASAPAEYFNIQGMKVDAGNLAPGMYIVRQGNKAHKVIIR